MDSIYPNKPLDFINQGKRNKPPIEVVKVEKGETNSQQITEHEIIFFIEGYLRYAFDDFPEYEGVMGQMLFIPAGTSSCYEAICNSILIVFRTEQPIRLYETFFVEKLYDSEPSWNDYLPCTVERLYGALEINPRLWSFLEGVHNCVSDGIECRDYFDMKIKELFIMLKSYYSKEELREFFAIILSGNTVFPEHIRLSWQDLNTVHEMADSMHMSYQQFYSHFVSAFNIKPKQWLNKMRAKKIYSEITSTDKPFKQIAIEYDFPYEGLLTRFCKRELGASPTKLRENGKMFLLHTKTK